MLALSPVRIPIQREESFRNASSQSMGMSLRTFLMDNESSNNSAHNSRQKMNHYASQKAFVLPTSQQMNIGVPSSVKTQLSSCAR